MCDWSKQGGHSRAKPFIQASKSDMYPNFCYIACYLTYKTVTYDTGIPTRGMGSLGACITCCTAFWMLQNLLYNKICCITCHGYIAYVTRYWIPPPCQKMAEARQDIPGFLTTALLLIHYIIGHRLDSLQLKFFLFAQFLLNVCGAAH